MSCFQVVKRWCFSLLKASLQAVWERERKRGRVTAQNELEMLVLVEVGLFGVGQC